VITPKSRHPLRLLKCSFRYLFFPAFMIWLCSAPAAVAAENPREKPYALIFGTVWGPDARPVYGVKVKIRRESEKKARWELYSDHNGEFAVRVPAGKQDYRIWADLKGFKSASGRQLALGEEVQVHVEYDERVDTGLHLTEQGR